MEHAYHPGEFEQFKERVGRTLVDVVVKTLARHHGAAQTEW
jgi:hypothetical protein